MKIGIVLYPTYGGSGVIATELGKGLATEIQKELAKNTYNKDHDASTLGLIEYYQSENIV